MYKLEQREFCHKHKKEYDIIAIGECLVDFVSGEKAGKLFMEGNPGGAPANVAAMASRLGFSTAMVAKLGKDSFGDFLYRQVKAAGVNTSHMVFTSEYPTTLAIVSLDETGNRSFSFYRGQTADIMLEEKDIPFEAIENSRILHFGSVSLTHQPSRQATLKAVRHAKAYNVLVSYDPNLRPLLWSNLDEARNIILEGLEFSDLVKLSEEELLFLTNTVSLEEGIEQLFNIYSMSLLAVTCGAKGCLCRTEAGLFSLKTFNVSCVDTTGAGDAFWGACLACYLDSPKSVQEYSADEVVSLMNFANAAGALATTQKGAIPAMPTRDAIEACIQTIPRCEST